ncbi:PREDICTED: mediator of RNA polymerase II transcription subunit 4 [Propithecus coquereli]|uniref:mediator of RNA polymerase II transcription subunit 4 n=1 Tax=Propithecus coquereli TaxID=379532 RepID=UPI00063F938B|nr:PREDICTED: mediator of RNA polymerase II transcription subunit 4 [Propithecus coquereli]
MAASSSGEKEKERLAGGSGAAGGNSTRERLLSALEDLEVLSRNETSFLRRPEVLDCLCVVYGVPKKATAVYQAKEKLKSIEKARKGDPRRPYPTDLEMRSGLLGQMNNPSTNGVNGHLPGDALAAGRLPGSRLLKHHTFPRYI